MQLSEAVQGPKRPAIGLMKSLCCAWQLFELMKSNAGPTTPLNTHVVSPDVVLATFLLLQCSAI